MKTILTISEIDKGAALLAWYDLAIKQFPEGLVTQAQAGRMLNVSRMAVSRLVTRGHLRAVYFPKRPDVEGLPVGNDDPVWLKLMAVLDPVMSPKDERPILWPEASFVAFADVKRLWEDAELRKKCSVDWMKVLVSPLKGSAKAPESKK